MGDTIKQRNPPGKRCLFNLWDQPVAVAKFFHHAEVLTQMKQTKASVY
jgi:hypothetical protein